MNRNEPLKRTGFARATLPPGSPWPPRTGGGITRHYGIGRGNAARMRRRTALKNPARNPNGPTDEVRELVLERDDYTCQCGCGQSIIGQRYSLGHRLRASQGGRAVASNLLVFLGWGGELCHGRIDRRDDEQDELNGMTVRSGQDPAEVGVMFTRADGSKVKRWLWDDGTRRDYSQGSAAA